MRRFRINIRDGETAGIAFGDPVRPVEILFLHATGKVGLFKMKPIGDHQFDTIMVCCANHGFTFLD
jgi:hypothetical protein